MALRHKHRLVEKLSPNTRSLLLFLTRLMLVGILLTTISLITMITWSWKHRRWDGNHRFSFISLQPDQSVVVVTYQPNTTAVVGIYVHPDIKLPLIHGFGNYRVSVVDDLGNQEGLGLSLLINSLENWFGMTIAGNVPSVTIQDNHIKGLGVGFIINAIKGDLVAWDALHFWWQLTRTRVLTQKIVDLTQHGYTQQRRLPDGTAEYSLDTSKMHQLALGLWQDDVVRADTRSLALINGTYHPGLATQASYPLSNLGYDIVSITEAESNENISILLIDDSLNDWQPWLNPLITLISPEIRIQPEVLDNYTAPAVLIVNEDYYQFLETKRPNP